MGFFMSPTKLLKVFTESAVINKKIQKHPVSWYFSKQGENAYKNAKTTPEKVELFYKYLLEARGERYETGEEFVQAIAYVMAFAMDGTSKPYGTWPGIIDKQVNPLVNFAIKYNVLSWTSIMKLADEKGYDRRDLENREQQLTIASAIAAVRGTDDTKQFMLSTRKAYENLTKQESDTEVFLIERCIIFALGNSYYDTNEGVGPYCYGLFEEDDDSEC